MNKWVGAAEAEFDLAETARYRDLLAQIGNRFGKQMPAGLWDSKRNAFAESVIALVGKTGEKIDSLDSPLLPGQEIHFFLMALGG